MVGPVAVFLSPHMQAEHHHVVDTWEDFCGAVDAVRASVLDALLNSLYTNF